MGILAGSLICLGYNPAEFDSLRRERAMASDDKPPKMKSIDEMKSQAKAPKDRPFDMWLQKQLHAMYDEITAEPLPDDLINLIENDASSSKKK
jgi:hypothetical protein